MTQYVSYQQYYDDLSEQVDRNLTHVNSVRYAARQSQQLPIISAWKAELVQVLKTGVDDSIDAESLVAQGVVRPPKNIKTDWRPDYALPTFEIAKQLKQNPMAIAQTVVESSANQTQVLSRVEAAGPYINVRLADNLLIESLQQIIDLGDEYGQFDDNAGKLTVMDLSSPNVAKPFGINHLRSTVIGEAIARTLEASGYTVVRDNHLGDWGTQFGNLLAAHEIFAPDTDFGSMSLDQLTEIYVKFSQEKKDKPEYVRLGQERFLQLEAGDEEARGKWAAALSLSLAEFNEMYERLHVHYDTLLGEAFFVDGANKLVEDLSHADLGGLVKTDPETGAVYADSEHPVMLRTQDGYCVYVARDLEGIRFRSEKYSPTSVLYVVGEEQASSFRVLFEVAKKANLNENADGTHAELTHIGFGLLLDRSGKKLSTRKGTSGSLKSVIDALDARALEETMSRNPEMDPVQAKEIAAKISVGALIWNDLRTDRKSSVRFDIDRMLELGGGSVVDIIYTYSRTCSLLEKVGPRSEEADLPTNFSTETEHALSVRLTEMTDVLRKVTEAYEPHHLVAYIQELTQLHGKFYEESRVAGIDDEQLKNLRVSLHKAYATVIRNGFRLLNVPLSERL